MAVRLSWETIIKNSCFTSAISRVTCDIQGPQASGGGGDSGCRVEGFGARRWRQGMKLAHSSFVRLLYSRNMQVLLNADAPLEKQLDPIQKKYTPYIYIYMSYSLNS